ncbi:MAG: T9SS type A sorting domain-containing protein [Bacteroidota bacterium]
MNTLRNTLLLCLCLVLASKAKADSPQWHGNDHFKVIHQEGMVRVAMNKMSWESFSVNIKDLASAKGIISFEVKTSQPIRLQIDGFTADKTQVHLWNAEVSGDDFQPLFYNLSSSAFSIDHLIFYVNPGEAYQGEVYFKGLGGSTSVEGEGATRSQLISLFPNPAREVVNIGLPNENFDQLSIYDVLGRLVLEQAIIGANQVVNLQGRRAGVYLIKARSRSHNAVLTTRLTVQ